MLTRLTRHATHKSLRAYQRRSLMAQTHPIRSYADFGRGELARIRAGAVEGANHEGEEVGHGKFGAELRRTLSVWRGAALSAAFLVCDG